MDNPFFTVEYWDAAIRVAGPIGLAAIGVLLCSRAGILMVGVEGVMLLSAFFSIAGVIWTGSLWLGVCIAAIAGVVSSLVLGFLSMILRMGDIVGGLVMHIGAIGITGFLLTEWFSSGATTGGKLLSAPWPEVGGKGGAVVLHQEPLIYAAIVLAIGLHFFLRSRWGLKVRSSGESMRAASAFGVDLVRLRFCVLAVSGVIIGLAGAVVGIGLVGTFDTGVVAGRGFIALACVMLGAWQPAGALIAALVFGAAYALQFRVGLESLGGWLQLLPYALVLVGVAAVWGRTTGPAEEGRDIPAALRRGSRHRWPTLVYRRSSHDG